MTIYAFPSGHNPKTGRQEEGMTLRDYFAAKAMQANIGLLKGGAEQLGSTQNSVSEAAYAIADAMIEQRGK